ncbi:MAG TPA: SUMF1/EgtB/PvdO family nonheme iron enzyme [Candidatus Wallbacteria bacterium]|nr:SUMF1/EgtB/PvdO family nonheme iron enzyme [Candidatus Wallbacteria bacterium]
MTISKGFYLSATEITQKQWLNVMGEPAPCKFKGDDLPAESVSWNDCMEFVKKINGAAQKDIYRLPTEAEWEYACRANSPQKYCFGASDSGIDEYAWHFDNSNNKTHPVGTKKPNAWGLYDMHANVWEWCLDSYAPYMPVELSDPRGPTLNPSPDDKKVIRGGGWYNPKYGCTSSNRDAAPQSRKSSDMGMRLLKVSDDGANK